jgi:hypothetical protein
MSIYELGGCAKTPPIGRTQPPARYWRNWKDKTCSDTTYFDHGPGTTHFEWVSTGINNLDSLWVPPNAEVKLYGYRHQTGKTGTFNGTNSTVDDSSHSISGVKGMYSPLDAPWRGIGLNDAESSVFNILRPWDDHLNDCCTGDATNYDQWQCGDFKPGATVCDEFMLKCDGSTLKSEAQKGSGPCLKLCKTNPEACDSVKNIFCKNNPNDSWCSCLNIKDNVAYKTFLEKVKTKFGVAPTPVCSAFGGCSTGRDLENMFLTKTIRDQQGMTCPAYDVTDINCTVTGNNNIVDCKQVVVKETNNNTYVNPSPPPGKPPVNKPDNNYTNPTLPPGAEAEAKADKYLKKYAGVEDEAENIFEENKWLILIIFVIFIVFGIFVLSISDDPPIQQLNQIPQYNPQYVPQ